jgi:transposase
LTILHESHVDVAYVSGTLTAHLSKVFHGDRKTDAGDAETIARIRRFRRDLRPLAAPNPVREQLRLWIGRRHDLCADRVRTINRMRHELTAISPALAGVLDLSLRGPVYLVERWQTPAMIRDAGPDAIADMLRRHYVSNSARLAAAVVAAADTQTVHVVAEQTAAIILRDHAADLIAISRRIDAVVIEVGAVLARHPLAAIVTSMPGIGTVLGAELLAITGTMARYPTSAAFAAHAGLLPVPRSSGTITGHERPPTRYHRGLRKVLFQSSLTAIRTCRVSRAYYDRKRAEGKNHRQAMIALCHRRAIVLWTLGRRGTPYRHLTPA